MTLPTNTESVESCGCVYRHYRWGGWTHEVSCGAHPIEPERPDQPTPEERQSAREFGSRSAMLP